MITKVISGGQTGADIAGLRAAKAAGLATGGYMTKGCRTQAGCKPQYIEEYGMEELPYTAYKPRTLANVFAADVTIRFATKWNSPGEICTLNAIKRYNKPHLDISVYRGFMNNELVETIANEIDKQDYSIINIAGNSERTSPGIEKKVESFLYMVFHVLVVA